MLLSMKHIMEKNGHFVIFVVAVNDVKQYYIVKNVKMINVLIKYLLIH